MIISMIAAMADDRIIGKDNQMPWHLPADFAWFKRCTLGKPIVMGRKTYDSIGRPLPGRLNIVITRDTQLQIEGVTVVQSIEQAIEAAGEVEELMIIGGGSIYEACLDRCERLYLTFIKANVDGDTRFPQWDDAFKTVATESFSADEKNVYDMDFVVLERNR
ncbi:type 3 dihydrofolate reductase [Vibrio agarivorans]|uniref:type 3 dihydrofolate reductase n=1 Tax=Vibrio agarivorans TaxID=153622 RepID=UPI0025B2F814|nr:type 3 dihydrofolate reductase [Vibrio agarivorans]MDN3661645.1 type 3 dihydrofolate reductase [Vibrio agarivorans]